MTKTSSLFIATAITAILAASAFSGAANASSQGDTQKLLTAQFETRRVIQVEIGGFHFTPGQIAPIHTHEAPAVGYVAKGEIIYQVEGEKQKVLREGDAFYEPTGKRILRFDNASATEEAIFLDFNLQQANEPFIVFEQQPSEVIDRRSLPTIEFGGEDISQVDIYASELEASESITLHTQEPILGLVAEGIVKLQVDGNTVERIVAGGSFSLTTIGSSVTVVNASSEVPAKVITFRLN